MNRRIVYLLLLALLLTLPLSGCGEGKGFVASAREETHLRLRNGTGWDIVALALCDTSANTGYQKNLLVQDYILRNGAWIDLFYPYHTPAETEIDLNSATRALTDRGENSPLIQPEYRMLMVLSDGRYFELSKFPIGDMSEGTLLLEEGVGYLSYLSLSSQQLVSTKGAEHATIAMFGKAEVDLSAVLSAAAARTDGAEKPDSAAAPTPTPQLSLRPAATLGDEDEDAWDPNEGCLTDGLFY